MVSETENQDDAAPAVEPQEAAEAADQLAALTAERERLTAENAELQDMLLRRQADFENFRRRVERDRAEFAEYANMEGVRLLLPVLDDFERALMAAPDDSGPWAEYAKGMNLIYQRLRDALLKLGLEPIESVGQPFNPNLHEAVQTVPREDCDDHTVVEEYQKGYNFKGRLLRAAMVVVAVKP